MWNEALHQAPLRGAETKTAKKTFKHTVGEGKWKLGNVVGRQNNSEEGVGCQPKTPQRQVQTAPANSIAKHSQEMGDLIDVPNQDTWHLSCLHYIDLTTCCPTSPNVFACA